MNDQIPIDTDNKEAILTSTAIQNHFPSPHSEANPTDESCNDQDPLLTTQEEDEIQRREQALAEKEKQIEEEKKALELLKQQKVTDQNSPLTIEPINLTDQKWSAEYEAVVGLKHRKPLPPNPCQDAAFASAPREDAPFSVVISADGAGSCMVSDIGAQRIVAGIYRLIHTLYRSQFNALDEEETLSDDLIKRWALILTKHAKGILEDLAKEYRRESNDFRCTLLVGIVGKYQAFWFKVGDGALVKEVAEKNANEQIEYRLAHLGMVGKGEYANETVFISNQLTPDKVQFGTFNAANLSGLFSMSDGAASKLVSNDGERVSGRLSSLAQALREKTLNRMHLTKLFYSEEFLGGHDGDDCSIALIAR